MQLKRDILEKEEKEEKRHVRVGKARSLYMARKSVLGDTLDSIFDDLGGLGGASEAEHTLRIGEIEPNREQPRRDFDPEKLEFLADSIRQHGLIQPITVRELHDKGVYQIVAGERRWRAARIAGLEEVPVRIMELTDSQTMQIALIENLQREDLNPVEEAAWYQKLIDDYSMTQDKVAKFVGRARSSVANSLRLLMLPDEVLELVRKNMLSLGHCKAIMSAQSTNMMIRLAKDAAAGELSVRETERLAKLSKESGEGNPPKRVTPVKKPFFTETELALGQSLNTKVKVVVGKKTKTLCIEFSSDDELKNIISKF
ncbi:MAG: ParB/RepB/Spo0J family partition protein [Oscillospiraceae bacterium]|nr:ParB/RepB/Spo0J family partition protein [Oscillospiraceae bacterium]